MLFWEFWEQHMVFPLSSVRMLNDMNRIFWCWTNFRETPPRWGPVFHVWLCPAHCLLFRTGTLVHIARLVCTVHKRCYFSSAPKCLCADSINIVSVWFTSQLVVFLFLSTGLPLASFTHQPQDGHFVTYKCNGWKKEWKEDEWNHQKARASKSGKTMCAHVNVKL